MIKGNQDVDGVTLVAQSRAARATIDQTSKAIIAQLQQDGRRPYADIAASLGLSEDAVRRRVDHLVEAGFMQITAVTDPLQLGFARQAVLGITVTGDVKTLALALAAMEEVVYVVHTAGGFDLMAEVVGESDAHLLEVTARIRPLPGVTSIQTFLYLELVKQVYTWGVR